MSSVADSSESYSLPLSEAYPSSFSKSYPSAIEHYPTGESYPSRRCYSDSLKIEAARLVLEQNLSMQKVAGQLHCSPMSVKKWVDQYRDHVTHQDNAANIISHPTTQRQPTHQNSMPFLPVQVIGKSVSSTSNNHFEIITPGGLTLRLPGETAIGILAGLVRELESASC